MKGKSTILAGLVCAALVGCGGDGSDSVPSTCYQPTAKTAAVPSCAGTSLCLGTPQVVAVDPARCPASYCRWSYQEDVGDTLTYASDDLWVFVRFTGSIRGATSTTQLTAASPAITIIRDFPVRGGRSGLTASYPVEGRSPSTVDRFELVKGRLHVKASFTVRDPYAYVSGSCTDSGQCLCTYDGVDIPSTIEIDLPADIPAS